MSTTANGSSRHGVSTISWTATRRRPCCRCARTEARTSASSRGRRWPAAFSPARTSATSNRRRAADDRSPRRRRRGARRRVDHREDRAGGGPDHPGVDPRDRGRVAPPGRRHPTCGAHNRSGSPSPARMAVVRRRPHGPNTSVRTCRTSVRSAATPDPRTTGSGHSSRSAASRSTSGPAFVAGSRTTSSDSRSYSRSSTP